MFLRQPLQYFYKKKIKYELGLKLNYKILNTIPKINKIILTLSSVHLNKKYLEDFFGLLELITKQNSKVCFSKKAVIHLKIQKNQIIGFSVILQKEKMFDFLLRFIAITLSRFPFFKPYSFKFNKGKISFKYNKFYLFHEIEKNKTFINLTNFLPDLNITIHTTTKSKYESLLLLRNLQIPCNQIF